MYDILCNRGTVHMLIFLQYVLLKINSLNVEFQSEHFRLHRLYLMVTSEYKNIMSCFIKDELMTNTKLSEIDPCLEINHKHIDDLYLGGRSMTRLIKQPLDNETITRRFKSDCLKFLVELCNQIRKRFPFGEDGVIAKLKVLDPKIAHDLTQSPSSIISLAVHFPSIVPEHALNDLDDEWRSFRLSADKLPTSSESIPEYWYKLSCIKDGLNNSKYSLLSDLMTNLTILPHSSACVERIFSLMNCVKTKSTNSLKTETVKDRLLAKQTITRNNMECTT